MTSDLAKTFAALAALLIVLVLASFSRRGPAVLTPAEQVNQPEYTKLIKIGQTQPELRAEAALVKRLKTGEVLYEKNADRRLPIASLTKLMTAMLLAELDQPLAKVEFSSEAKQAGGVDDNRSPVTTGDSLKAEEVLKLLLISSSNDAAYAAAEYVSRYTSQKPEAQFAQNLQGFVDRMNERASNLGLINTHFANPTGRDHPENFSTTKDLTALSAFLADYYPELWTLSRIQETFVFGAGGQRYGLVNTNPLLGEFPAIYGSKTGFDEQAKGALAIIYQLRPDEFFSIIILRSPDRFSEGRALIKWLETNFVIESR